MPGEQLLRHFPHVVGIILGHLMGYTPAMRNGMIAAASIVGAVFLAVGAVYVLHTPAVAASGTATTTQQR